MPIYMDFHDLSEVTIEEARKAHLNDISVQEKYKVKYLQYWVNEKEGKVYCLIKAPSKAACKATHKEANGISACNLVEVKSGMYDLFLGDNQKIDHGLVRHFNEEVDNGYRFIMSLSLMRAYPLFSEKMASKKTADQLKLECIGIVEKFNGRDINQPEKDSVTGIFRTPDDALNCSMDLRNHILNAKSKTKYKSFKFKIGLCVGQPVTKDQGFFEKALNFAQLLCDVSKFSEITTSLFFAHLSNLEDKVADRNGIRTIHTQDADFLLSLHTFITDNLDKESLNVDLLAREMYVSRAQLYRKIKSLTGASPNHFIRDQRLDKSVRLLKKESSNISEIALDVGFNNPSYFSKCFQKRFGVSPSKIK